MRRSVAAARQEDEASNLVLHSSDERWLLVQLCAVPFFLRPSLGVACALACNLRPSLSTVCCIPAEAFTSLGWPVDFAVPLRRFLGHLCQCGRHKQRRESQARGRAESEREPRGAALPG